MIGGKVEEREPSKGRERKGKETFVIVIKPIDVRRTKMIN